MDGTEEQKGLHDFIDYCTEERFDQLEEQFDDTEYEALEKENSDIFRMIHKHLPNNIKDYILEYEDNTSRLCGLTERYYYKAGFKDAVALVNLVFGIKVLERNL